MKEPAVANSTCLIGLERIGRLDLLQELFEPVFIPPKVQEEFGVAIVPSVKPLLEALKQTGFHLSSELVAEVLRLVGKE